MSVLTRVQTVEERVSRTQLPEQTPARPPSTWPLAATLLPGARLTWAEWVDWQTSQLTREAYGERPSHLEASATSH
jgi:hypothetical protein